MLTPTQIERLAAMANALRPDWPTRSIQTHITTHHNQRAYRDLALALTYVATDSESSTPARLNQPGPWWRLTTVVEGPPQPPRRCEACSEYHGPGQPCPARSHSDYAATGAAGMTQVRAAYTRATARLCPHGVGWRDCHQHNGHVIAGEVVKETE
jgi:hypothetical protein